MQRIISARSSQRRSGFFIFQVRRNNEPDIYRRSIDMKIVSSHMKPAVAALAIICSVIAPVAMVQADAVTDSGARATQWLVKQQMTDGGYGSGFSIGSDIGATADAVIAIAAAKVPLSTVKNAAGLTPVDYLKSQVTTAHLSTGQYAKIALAVKAAGLNPAQFSGKDLRALISAGYNEKTGVYGDTLFVHAEAILALATTGAIVPAQAIATLESKQSPTGGWSFMGSGVPDVDTTSTAVQALIAVGQPAKTGSAGRGMGYLHSLQNTDGGFPYQSPSPYGTDTNANSTALVAQAIIASGDQPESWAAPKGNPLSAIINLQQRSGAFAYQAAGASDNSLATIGSIQALYRITSSGK
jgi:prenyltransferase beta subunit